MKKFFVILAFLCSLLSQGQQLTPVPFSSLTIYSGNLDSIKLVGLLKSGNAWTNRVFYGIDLVKYRLLISDTSSMLAAYARAFNYYTKAESDARFLQSFTETDPFWSAASANYYTKVQADGRYLQSITGAGLDNVFSTTGLLKRTGAGAYSSITDNSSNWNTAFSWGNHASAGYELSSNKATTLASPDNTKYPTTLAVSNAIPTNNNQLTNGSGFITGNQTITASGDASGSGQTSISLTVNGLKGVALPTLGATAGLLKYTGTVTNTWVFDNNAYLTTAVTSVGLSYSPTASNVLSVSGSPITTSGSFTVSLQNQNANIVFAGPTTGAATTPTFRSLVAADIPTVTNAMHSTMAAHTYKGNNTGSTATPIDVTTTQLTADLNQFTTSLQGLVPGSGGGTINFLRADGTWTAPPSGFANPMTTQGDIIFENATPAPARLAGPTSSTKQFLTSTGTGAAANNPAWGTIAAGDIPTLNQNTTGSAGSISGTNVVTNSNLSQMAANTIKGNNTGSPANATDLTTSQVKTLLAIGESDVTNLTTDLAAKAPLVSVVTGLTAAGSTQGTALALSGNNSVQEFTTVAANTGGKLPTATASSEIIIVNRGANFLSVYPNTSGVINGQSANTPYIIPAGGSVTFIGKDATSWYTDKQITGGDVGETDGSASLTIVTGAVSLTKMANLAANSIIGNNTGSAATPIALTAAQVKTLLSLNNVENTALSTWAGSTSLVTLGTVTSGTWSATAIAETKGGTNQTTYTLGDLLYASASNTLSKLGGNTTSAKQFLTMTGTGTVAAAPSWGAIAAGDVPTLNQNTTGTASNITGVLNSTSFPALTGDVTTSSGSLATAIGTNRVTSAMLRQGVATSVIGVTGGSTANEADIQGTVDNQFLSRKSAALGFNAFGGQAGMTAASAAINTTETILTSYVIPANTMIAGTTYRVTVYGTCTSSVANASNIRLRLGTAGTTSDAAVCVITPTSAASGTTIPFKATLFVTIRTTGGGTGTTAGMGDLNNNGITGISAAADVISALTTTSALNTTVQNTLSLTYVSAATTTTSTFQLATIEIAKM